LKARDKHRLVVEVAGDASDPGGTAAESNLPQDVRNMPAERADASFDHRHRFVANAIWTTTPEVSGDGWATKLTSN
jgi:hypothetical protein